MTPDTRYTSAMPRTIRIGNGQGFWGDIVDAPFELIAGGPIDYLGMDYLAEVTLSIMMRQQLQEPAQPATPPTSSTSSAARCRCSWRRGSGSSPTPAASTRGPAATKVFELARELGISRAEGRRRRGRRPAAAPAGACARPGITLANMDTGEPLAQGGSRQGDSRPTPTSAPARSREALDEGAQIVLAAASPTPRWRSGRWCTSSAGRRTTGTASPPARSPATSSSAAPSATGGNFTRWWEVPDLWDVGYPIVEVEADGTFVVTKHPGTGGLVTVDTVTEQLVYEMGDPRRYITPDVRRRLHLDPARGAGTDRVRVCGDAGRGRRRPSSRSPPRTSTATRRPDSSSCPARARSRRRGSPPRSSGSGSSAPASVSRGGPA